MWAYACVSFQQVVEACSFLSSPPVPLAKEVWRTLYTGIVVSYARPFTRSYGGERLPENIVPKKHLSFHAAIMDTRHKESAHIDASTYQADDPQVGNINQVRVTFTKTNYYLSATSTNLAILEIKQLSHCLLTKAEYHTEKFRLKYISTAALPPGEYKLNLDPNVPGLFVNAEPAVQIAKIKRPSISSPSPSAPSLPPNI